MSRPAKRDVARCSNEETKRDQPPQKIVKKESQSVPRRTTRSMTNGSSDILRNELDESLAETQRVKSELTKAKAQLFVKDHEIKTMSAEIDVLRKTKADLKDEIAVLTSDSNNSTQNITVSASNSRAKLAELGFCFQNGKLRTIQGDNPFVFSTQESYEELGDAIGQHIYEMLEWAGLERRHVKMGCSRRFYFVSTGYEQKERILVLINGSGVVRAGQWTRKLIINDSLDRGSQLPYIRRALANGWGVVVLNHNENCEGRQGKCHSLTAHGGAEYRHALKSAKKDAEVVVVAHSAGGYIASDMCRLNVDGNKRVVAVALTEGSLEDGCGHNVHAANWNTTRKELRCGSDGVHKLYSGDDRSIGTSATAINSIFSMLEGVSKDTTGDEFRQLLVDCEKIVEDEVDEERSK